MLVSVEDGRRLEDDPEERRRRAIAALDRLEALGRTQRARETGRPSAGDAVRMDRDRDDA